MTDRQPGAPGQYTLNIDAAELQKLLNGEACTIILTRNDMPIVEGTPYNKASVLPDDLAGKICPNVTDPTPADALGHLHGSVLVVELTKNGWSNGKQTVNAAGVTTSNRVYVAPLPDNENWEAYTDAGIRCVQQKNGSLVFSCESAPSVNVSVSVDVRA